MPKTDQATYQSRTERVFFTLRQYPNGLTEAELEQLTGFQRRSLNNYLRALETEGKVFKDGITWAALPYDRVQLRRFDLQPEEAMALYLAARLFTKYHDKRNEPAETALMKLADILTADAGVGREIHEAARQLAQRPDAAGYHDIFRKVMQAYLFRRVLRITYSPLNGQPFETDFAPYLIEPSAIGFTIYVIGHSSLVNGWRTYKLERIRSAALTRQEYAVPPDFPGLSLLQNSWSIMYGEKTFPVVVRFSPAVRQRVAETRWHPSQTISDDPDRLGWLRWEVQVADTLDLLPWLRSWGADAEVLIPDNLRDLMLKETRRLARLYGASTRSQLPETDRLLRCWGKTDFNSHNASEFHPAVFHMLDVGHVAQELLGARASPRWRRVLASALNTDPERLVDWLPWLVALHDIGKISAPFQALNAAQKARLSGEGFDFGQRGWDNAPHHTLIGQVFSAREFDPAALTGALRGVWHDMLGGHHGNFVSSDQAQDARHALRDEPKGWSGMRATAAGLLKAHLLNAAPAAWPAPENLSAASLALTGFTILCDWLGSDGQHFPLSPETPLDDYLMDSRARAQQAVAAAGLADMCLSSATPAFATLFPQRRPRPLQVAIDAIPVDVVAQPCLAILEAPTGEGKTEAALALAHRLAIAAGTDELYYALPTAATSNQMFVRLQRYLRDGLGLTTHVKLIHSQALLVEDDLRVEPLDNGDGRGNAAALEWFGPKKRAVLAPFGVGTVDQAELAALNVPHVALRLIGLAGKVVIVDEVHAYDTYMSTIIERLLTWLGMLRTSVILLSATLPKSRRLALAQAYGAQPGPEWADHSSYPSLWVTGLAGQHRASPPAIQPERRLELVTLDFGDDDAGLMARARWLVEQVEAGGCACWMTNTVDRAQGLFQAVEELAPAGVVRTLLHARFPLDERQEREAGLTRAYGPDVAGRPERAIVIGTQVLEQSLDLDFDVMATDLAPVDLLLQRAGRLHRHSRARPASHSLPRLFLNVPHGVEGDLALGADARIYAEYILRQTWQTLAGRQSIILPADYRPLIESVYSAAEPDGDDPLARAWAQLQRDELNATGEARQRLLPLPHPEDSLADAAAQLMFAEDENSAAWAVAQTRLGEESLTIIPLERRGDQATMTVNGETRTFDLSLPAARPAQLQLLRRSLRLSHRAVVPALRQSDPDLPPLFAKAALLRDCRPLWLTDGVATLRAGRQTYRLRLDPRLGLVIRKERVNAEETDSA